MPSAPVRILFAERLPAAVGTPEPLFDKPTYATSAKIISSRGRVVNTGAVYLGQRTVFDSTLNVAVDNGTATGLTPAATSQDRTGDKQVGPQVEAATVAGTITSGTRQVETATAAGTITSGTKQVETATVVATITEAGDASVIVTGALVGDSPKEILVPVAVDDDASAVAGKIRAALNIAPITTHYVVSGATDKVILTAKVEAANDATLNIKVADGSCVGITTAASSANTTAGVSPGTMEVTVTSALFAADEVIDVAVAKGDTATALGTKLRAALAANAVVAEHFTISGAAGAAILTAKVSAANDATLNVALADGTCVGVTPAASSTNTTAGVAAGTAKVTITGAGITGSPLDVTAAVLLDDDAATVAGKLRTALLATAAVTAVYDISGSGAEIVLTRKDVILNDTMKYPMAAGATLELEAGEDGTLDLSQIVVDAVTLGDGVQIVYTQPARF